MSAISSNASLESLKRIRLRGATLGKAGHQFGTCEVFKFSSFQLCESGGGLLVNPRRHGIAFEFMTKRFTNHFTFVRITARRNLVANELIQGSRQCDRHG